MILLLLANQNINKKFFYKRKNQIKIDFLLLIKESLFDQFFYIKFLGSEKSIRNYWKINFLDFFSKTIS